MPCGLGYRVGFLSLASRREGRLRPAHAVETFSEPGERILNALQNLAQRFLSLCQEEGTSSLPRLSLAISLAGYRCLLAGHSAAILSSGKHRVKPDTMTES